MSERITMRYVLDNPMRVKLNSMNPGDLCKTEGETVFRVVGEGGEKRLMPLGGWKLSDDRPQYVIPCSRDGCPLQAVGAGLETVRFSELKVGEWFTAEDGCFIVTANYRELGEYKCWAWSLKRERQWFFGEDTLVQPIDDVTIIGTPRTKDA